MIEVYNPNNTNYAENGDMTLEPIVAKLDATINGSWLYTLSHPTDNRGRWKYIEAGGVIKAPSFNGQQYFRIKAVNKDEAVIKAEAEPIFLDAKDDLFITSKRIVNKDGKNALRQLLEGSSMYAGVTDLMVSENTAYYYYVNLVEAINGNNDNSFLKRWGGEILYDNWTINILEQLGADNGTEIRYGKNIPVNGFTEDIDYRDIATRVYPTAYNGYTMANYGYVDSPLIDRYPTVHAKTIQYNDVKMFQDIQETDLSNGTIICSTQSELDAALRKKVLQDYDNGLDKPSIKINAKMILLDNAVGYEEYKELMAVGLGDVIHCHHAKLGIITDARVTSLTYDSIAERVSDVTLTTSGKAYNYFKDVTDVVNQTKDAFNKGANSTIEINGKTVTIEKGLITSIK